MAVLPEGGVISGVIEVQDEPSLTWLAAGARDALPVRGTVWPQLSRQLKSY